MQAAVLEALHTKLALKELPEPQPAPGEAVVRLHAAALNHRDVFIQKGMYAKIKLPAVLGSDGAGEVLKVGEGVDPGLIGQRVLIIPCQGWGPDPKVQGRDFVILGMPASGTFAQAIARPADRLVTLPQHLSFQEGAALPLAGLTAWRALVSRGGVTRGEHVLVTGVGGGVSTMALILAQALGARVSVTSGSEEKLARARSLGAIAAVSYKDPDWGKKLVEAVGTPPSLIIDSVGGNTLNQLVNLCAPAGRIVTYGSTLGKVEGLELPRLFFKQIDLRGSTMGTDDDFRAMVDLVARERLKPVVDRVFPLAQAEEALRHMDGAQQMGKIVLDCG